VHGAYKPKKRFVNWRGAWRAWEVIR